MTREELRSLPVGVRVEHEDFGICIVAGHSIPVAVNLVITSGKKIMGRNTFGETRHDKLKLLEEKQ